MLRQARCQDWSLLLSGRADLQFEGQWRTSGMLCRTRNRTLDRPNHCRNDSAADPLTKPASTRGRLSLVCCKHATNFCPETVLIVGDCESCLGCSPVLVCTVSRRAAPWQRPVHRVPFSAFQSLVLDLAQL